MIVDVGECDNVCDCYKESDYGGVDFFNIPFGFVVDVDVDVDAATNWSELGNRQQ